ncbi:MAG: WD40/YVTN/BNR-like repeat-containing protein, partial [Saprospiraceae bacterium]
MKSISTLFVLMIISISLAAQWKALDSGGISNQNQNLVITVNETPDNSLWGIVFNKNYIPTLEYLRSTDGGLTVEAGTFPGTVSSDGAFDLVAFSADVAYVTVINRSSFTTGYLYKTIDGGTSWTNITPNFGSGIVFCIHFWDETEGLMYTTG